MSSFEPLHLLGEPPPERRDAARNRERLLESARCLVEEHGVDAVTMDAVAAAAGVGKGTIFRRFGSREGLMAAILDHSESRWQGAVMGGPPPLGPGADPWDRLVAFGRSRLETSLTNADLIRAAGRPGGRAPGAYNFGVLHTRHLLEELGVTGDLPLLTVALLAPLELPILDQQIRVNRIPLERVHAAWVDLARRISGRVDEART